MKWNFHSSTCPKEFRVCSSGFTTNRAFTLTELIVVLATIAVLGGLLLPALAATHDRSSRSLCQYNLHQISVAITLYAGENNGLVVPVHGAGGLQIPIAIDDGAFNRQIGLSTNLNGNSIWTCPNRPTLPILTPPYGGMYVAEWYIGYQYYGGVTNWNTPVGVRLSRSPVNLSQAKPYWMLAADANIRDDVGWGHLNAQTSGQLYLWDNIPPHRTSDASPPQGGNEVFCDGSVQWIDYEKMYCLYMWFGSGGVSRYCLFYQDPKDFADSHITPIDILNIRAYKKYLP